MKSQMNHWKMEWNTIGMFHRHELSTRGYIKKQLNTNPFIETEEKEIKFYNFLNNTEMIQVVADTLIMHYLPIEDGNESRPAGEILNLFEAMDYDIVNINNLMKIPMKEYKEYTNADDDKDNTKRVSKLYIDYWSWLFNRPFNDSEVDKDKDFNPLDCQIITQLLDKINENNKTALNGTKLKRIVIGHNPRK